MLKKKSQQALDLAENYTSLISLVPCHIYWKDKEGRYLGCNLLQAQNLGFSSPEEIIGKTDFELPWRAQAQALQAADQEVMKTKKDFTLEEEVILANNKKSYFLSKKAALLTSDGEVKGIIGISFDITDRKTIEEELKNAKEAAELANKAKTEFLENMRHDIRTPLTGIVGFSEIMKTEFEDPRIKEYADNLVASSQALLHFLDEILESIRVSSGEIPKLKKKFNLKKILHNILDLNRAKAAEKRLELLLDYDETIPSYVIGDNVRLHRVVLELLSNALNFTDNGFVKLSTKLAKRTQREVIIKLMVEDSGIGIPKNKQQDIYVQFTRLIPSYQGIYKGAGLGLSVIKQFIEDLQGEIYIKSIPKKGSVFTCVFPLQVALLDDATGIDVETDTFYDKPLETTYAQQIQSEKTAKSMPKKIENHILVVEDNVIAQRVAKAILQQCRCSVDIAETGTKAIELWKSHHYDLIFMDIGLPDMDGYEVTRLIREKDLVNQNHTPIIALTAHVGEENKQRCIEAGMDAVLSKPLTPKNCADIVDSFIPKRHKNSKNVDGGATNVMKDEENLFDIAKFPILDIEEGKKTMGDVGILKEMLELLIQESLPEDLANLKDAYQNKNWETVQQIAHKIKGGAIYVGAIKLKMACQYLERYWKNGQREQLEPLYQQVIQVIDESYPVIRDWVNFK